MPFTNQSRLRPFVVAMAFVLTTALSGCGDSNADIEAPPPVLPDDDTIAFAEDRVEFVGRDVTISGEVGTKLAPSGFLLTGSALGDEPVLVVAPKQPAVNVGDQVTVTGTVRNFDVITFRRDLDEPMDDVTYAPYAGQPAIMATTVEPIAGASTTSSTAGSPSTAATR